MKRNIAWEQYINSKFWRFKMDTKSDESMKLLAVNFVNRLVLQKYEEASLEFDEPMNAMFNTEKLKETWEKYVQDAGSLIQINPTKTAKIDEYTTVLVQCEFQLLKINVQVVYNKQNQISGLSFTPIESVYSFPSYVDKGSFKEFDVSVGSGEWELPGTLTIPNGNGPFNGVVLVHGSGPNDRDETLGPNKPFKDLALGLASHGIAVLRYDKRTLVHSNDLTPEIIRKMTVKEEVVDDAVSAVQLLKETESINPHSIFVLGHSLGATLAPRINEIDKEIYGVIIMAGFTRALEDIILDQYSYIYSLTGNLTEEQNKDLEILKQKVDNAKKDKLSETTLSKDLPWNIPVEYWKDLHNYNPLKTALNLESSILILQGERDYQVSEEKDFQEWKKVLKHKPRTDFKLFPNLNHIFMTGDGKSTPQEYLEEGHVAKEVIETIVSWIKKQNH